MRLGAEAPQVIAQAIRDAVEVERAHSLSDERVVVARRGRLEAAMKRGLVIDLDVDRFGERRPPMRCWVHACYHRLLVTAGQRTTARHNYAAGELLDLRREAPHGIFTDVNSVVALQESLSRFFELFQDLT